MGKGIIGFIILIIIAGGIATVISLKPSEEKFYNSIGEEYEARINSDLTGDKWPKTELTKKIPTPTTGTLKVIVQGKSRISFEVSDVDMYVYSDYVKSAIKMGFINGPDESSGYAATNDDGYMIDIRFTRGTMSVMIS